jgi:uncharacterized protein (DUF2267 family)
VGDVSTATFYRRVLDETGGTDRRLAERGTAAVLRALRDRLTPDEARQLAAQLPRALREIWDAGADWGVRPVKLHRRELYERVKADAALPSIREARVMVVAVFAALKSQISPGESDDVSAQLPADLRELWAEAGAWAGRDVDTRGKA